MVLVSQDTRVILIKMFPDLAATTQFTWRSVHSQMIMCRSIGLNALSGFVLPLDEDQKAQLLYPPFTAPNLFGGRGLVQVQKINLEGGKSFNVISHPVDPSTSYSRQPYVGQGRSSSYRRGSSSKWVGGGGGQETG